MPPACINEQKVRDPERDDEQASVVLFLKTQYKRNKEADHLLDVIEIIPAIPKPRRNPQAPLFRKSPLLFSQARRETKALRKAAAGLNLWSPGSCAEIQHDNRGIGGEDQGQGI